MDIFTEYFSECSEQRIKDNYVVVYEVGVIWEEWEMESGEGGGVQDGLAGIECQ